MAKTGAKQKQKKPSKEEQYERFQEAARKLGVDNEESAELFERTFEKIVPPKRSH
jgi:hypothetical protein